LLLSLGSPGDVSVLCIMRTPRRNPEATSLKPAKARSLWRRLQTTKTDNKTFIHLPDGGRVVYDHRTGIAEIEITKRKGE
jgi:hypothetical protein